MENKCIICKNQINSNNNTCTSECGHLFHLNCFIQQIKDFRCPTCNYQLISPFSNSRLIPVEYDQNNVNQRNHLQQAYRLGYMDHRQVTSIEFFRLK